MWNFDLKWEGFQVPIFEKTVIKLENEITKGSFLYVPEAETNFLGRGLITQAWV